MQEYNSKSLVKNIEINTMKNNHYNYIIIYSAKNEVIWNQLYKIDLKNIYIFWNK